MYKFCTHCGAKMPNEYQAMDILKQSAPLQNNPSPSVNNFSPQAPFFPQNPNNHGNQQFASNPNNQTNQNNDNST